MSNLTLENHLEFDSTMVGLALVDTDYKTVPLEKYIDVILNCRLGKNVPQEVREIYDRSKETMCYGIYHYPLFTAGRDLLHLSYEAALYFFSQANGHQVKIPMLRNMIKFCDENSLLTQAQLTSWNVVKVSRNSIFHQKQTSLLQPNVAINSLHHAKTLIDELFE